MGRLTGRVALITGAASGLGAITAEHFASEGAKVIIADVQDGEPVAAKIGDAATYIHHDVTSEDSWEAVMSHTLKSHGGLNILVNNAGINHVSPLATFPLADYRRVIEVNQIGVFLGMRACLPALVKGDGGSIINVSSTAGLEGCPCAAAYVASKYAVIGMTKVAALELGKFNVRVNSIHPGLMETRLTEGLTLDMRVPLDRLGKGIEVARLSLFLASSDSSYCTGQQFVVDGGLTSGDGPSAFFTMASDAVVAATA